jgi:hypothetical protein
MLGQYGWGVIVYRPILALAVLAVATGTAQAQGQAEPIAQSLPAGGYYTGGVYYVPSEPPVSATAQAATLVASACPLGYGVPTVYVASSPTMVRIQWVWPSGGGSAPGFPYVPAYTSQAAC